MNGIAAAVARPFWTELGTFGDRIALVDPRANRGMTYAALAQAVEVAADRLHTPRKGIVALFAVNRTDVIICLLAALRAGHCVHLLNQAMPSVALARLVHAYTPEFLVGPSALVGPLAVGRAAEFLSGDLYLSRRDDAEQTAPHPALAMLLSTSGSMGNPKTVRLSWTNLAINAAQIVQALSISPTDRSILALPLSYTYGLSVLTSHLSAGASLVVDNRSIIDREFWSACAQAQVTSLPAVTFTIDFLSHRPELLALSSLRKITHSGSRLSPVSTDWLKECSTHRHLSVYKMYGMTEATARVAVLDPEDFLLNPASVGRPVAGGIISFDSEGQIYFRGPNVMMGYCHDRKGVNLGDTCEGLLATGDIGVLDAQGRLEIKGRLSRIAKIFGIRMDLSEVEQYLSVECEVAVTSDDERIYVHYSDAEAVQLDLLVKKFCEEHSLPRQTMVIRRWGRLPRGRSGKVLYTELDS